MAETPKRITVNVHMRYLRWTVEKMGTHAWRIGRPDGRLWKYTRTWQAAQYEAERVARQYPNELIRANSIRGGKRG